MKQSRFTTLVVAVILILAGFETRKTTGATITFESPTYSLGDLTGQDGWGFNNNVLEVVADGSGGQWIQSGTNASTGRRTQRSINSALLDGADPQALSGFIRLDFDFRLDSYLSTDNSSVLSLEPLYDATNFRQLAPFAVRRNGSISSQGQTFSAISDANFHQVSVLLDFDNFQYDILVDNVTIHDDRSFVNNQTIGNQIRLTKNQADDGPSGGGAWFTVDNISYSAVPEPSTYALVIIGLIGIVCLRRQNNRNKA
ncbi:MAG: PEP-CTERM sorting domain-containing protein [Verrucomicrobiota bacterium]